MGTLQFSAKREGSILNAVNLHIREMNSSANVNKVKDAPGRMFTYPPNEKENRQKWEEGINIVAPSALPDKGYDVVTTAENFTNMGVTDWRNNIYLLLNN